jgi:restriction system protein
MGQDEQNSAVQILKHALVAAWSPFAWAAAAPSSALRRYRASIADNSQAAACARFDNRKWTLDLLKHLEWRRFEELCAAYYEALGFKTRLRGRADGAVEIVLCAEPDRASVLVHAKAWDAYRIGIGPLRDLRDAMAVASVRKGVLVTSGRFTREALNFAAQEHVQLIDGAGLLEKLLELNPEKSLALLQFTTQGDFLTPTCPACSVKMISRRSIQGGRPYWGCVNYPRCKQTFSSTA